MTPALTDVSVSASDCYPGAFYEPGPTCAAFIASEGRRDLLRAPNQVGKTNSAAKRMDDWCLANPGKRFGVLIADLDNHYAEVCAKIHEVITQPELDPATKYVDGKGYYTHGARGIRYKSGTRVLFRSGSGPLQGLESFSVDAAWVDEVPGRAHYNAFVRGVHGPVWVSFTPIGRDPAWFRRKVEGDPETGAPPEEPGWQQFVPSLSVEECPWREQWQIDEMIAKTDPFERAQRIYAAWDGPTEGRRFNAFDGESIIDGVEQRNSWRWRVAMDHGEGVGREHAELICYDNARVVIVDEYVNETATVPDEDAPGILAMLERNGLTIANVEKWVGDVNSAGKMGAGSSVNHEMALAIGRALGMPEGAIPVRIEKPDKTPGSVEYGERLINIGFSARKLQVCKAAARTIHAFWHYRGPKDEGIKHPIDTARYGIHDIMGVDGMPTVRFGTLRRR